MSSKPQKVAMNVSLSESDKTTKLAESTLAQYQKAQERIDIETHVIDEFFTDEQSTLTHNTVIPYMHNLLQYVFDEFFIKNNGFEKVKDFSIKDGLYPVQSRLTQIQYEKDKYFTAYADAYICLENKTTQEKLIIRIDKNYYGGDKLVYEIYTNKPKNSWFSEWKLFAGKNNFYKGKKIDPSCNFLDVDNTLTWDDIILPEKTINIVKSNVEKTFELHDLLKKNKISLKRGLIFTGPPGTGKTMLCKVLAKESQVTVLYVLPSNFDKNQDVSRICEMAKDLAPTLLIIEDIDYIAEDRDGSKGGWFVIELMNKMDGLENFGDVITIATTNALDKIEKAIKNRPGRFDRVINIPNPDSACRKKMLEKFTKNFIVSNVNFDKVVEKTDKMSGAYMKELCITAALFAIQSGSLNADNIAVIETKHFVEAVKEIKNKDFSTYHEDNKKPAMGFHAIEAGDEAW